MWEIKALQETLKEQTGFIFNPRRLHDDLIKGLICQNTLYSVSLQKSLHPGLGGV